jgi:hypothetical protein
MKIFHAGAMLLVPSSVIKIKINKRKTQNLHIFQRSVSTSLVAPALSDISVAPTSQVCMTLM